MTTPVVGGAAQTEAPLIALETPQAAPAAPAAAPAAGPVQPVIDQTPLAPTQAAELAYLRAQEAEHQQARDAAAIEATIRGRVQAEYQEALNRGLSEEDSRWIAEKHQVLLQKVAGEWQRARQAGTYNQQKQTAADAIGRDYGVAPALLLKGNTRQEMELIAQLEKQNARLRVLEQARVVPQTLDSVTGSMAGNVGEAAYLARLKAGQPLPPPSEIDRMTAKYANLRG
jgi:hypothetical protein